MRKIGSLHRFFTLIFFALAYLFNVHAQDLQVEATLSESNIFLGEQVRLEISVSGSNLNSIDQPELPEIEGMRWLRGSVSRNTSYTIVNGQTSVTYSFYYSLIAEKKGNFTIPEIEVSANNNVYRTEPINFKILDPDTFDSGEAERAPDIYLRLEPDKKSPLVGEQVIADVVLYFKQGIEVSSYQASPGWKAEGFWKEDLENPQRAQTSSTIINGVRYQRARLLQYAIFPTKQGELTLSPFEINVSVRTQRGNRDLFGLGMGSERITLQSTPVTLLVRPLPDIQDAQFIGAVGDFDIIRKISASEAYVGESIEITTTIQGTGNVPLINKPEYDFPEGLEKYNPQENSTVSRSNRQISGTRTFTDIVIARNQGTYTLPEKKVAYLNPDNNRYTTKVLPALTFEVVRNPDVTAVVSNDIRFDVKPVSGLVRWTTTSENHLYQKTWVWVVLVLPVLLTLGVFGYKQYQIRMHTDVAFARSRTAMDNAQKLLTKAEDTTNIKEGYRLIEKALIGFITDKLNLPPAGLSNHEIIDELHSMADSETISELKRLFTKCETISYAPNVTHEGFRSDLEKTRNLIKKIGKLV